MSKFYKQSLEPHREKHVYRIKGQVEYFLPESTTRYKRDNSKHDFQKPLIDNQELVSTQLIPIYFVFLTNKCSDLVNNNLGCLQLIQTQ